MLRIRRGPAYYVMVIRASSAPGLSAGSARKGKSKGTRGKGEILKKRNKRRPMFIPRIMPSMGSPNQITIINNTNNINSINY